MKWEVETRKARAERIASEKREKERRLAEELSKWHFFFALWPRRVTHGRYNPETYTIENHREEIVWLETIARCGTWDGKRWSWNYGPVTRVLEQ